MDYFNRPELLIPWFQSTTGETMMINSWIAITGRSRAVNPEEIIQ